MRLSNIENQTPGRSMTMQVPMVVKDSCAGLFASFAVGIVSASFMMGLVLIIASQG